MRKSIRAGSIAVALITGAVGLAPSLALATHDINIKWPSIPRFNVGGPRPPLTPKTSEWCNKFGGLVQTDTRVYWSRVLEHKHIQRFWPDYYQYGFRALYYDGNRWIFSWHYTTVYCDA